MTPLAEFLLRLAGIGDPALRWHAFLDEALAHGGTVILPGGEWGPHEAALSLHGVAGFHEERDAALADWEKAARRTVAGQPFVAEAEAEILAADRPLDEAHMRAATVVGAFSTNEAARRRIADRDRARRAAA